MSFPIRIRKDPSNGDVRKSLVRKQKKTRRRSAQKGQPLLHFAASDNQLESCQSLLEQGEDVNTQDPRTGSIALHAAVEEGNDDIVRLLLQHKANLTLPDLKGNNALHLAVLHGQSSTVEILLQAKANIEQRMKNSQSIFHLLPQSSLTYQSMIDIFHSPKISTIFYLINQAETENDWTPLHVACYEGRRELIKLYIDYGADIRACTKDNKTPREILLSRMEELRKDSKGVETYQELVSSIKYLSADYFTQTQVARVLEHKIPAIKLQSCELHDNTFYYLLLEMLDLKQKQKIVTDTFSATPRASGVSNFLTHLDLSHNHLTILPPEIKHLLNLQYFDLSYNELVTLPLTIGLFRKLKYLDVSCNQLTTLPPSFAELRDHVSRQVVLSELKLEGNEISEPPKRVVKQGIEAIIDYFAVMLEGDDRTCHDVSVVCLGPSGVGKSSLLRSLSTRQRGRSLLSRLASVPNLKEVSNSSPGTRPMVDVISFELKGSVKKDVSHLGGGSLQAAKEYMEGSESTESIDLDHLWKQFKESDVFHTYEKEEDVKAYTRYFVASDLVDWLVTHAAIATRNDAVQIGRSLEKSGLIRSEKKTGTFADCKLTFTICGEASSVISFNYSALDFSDVAINSPIPRFFVNACNIIILAWDTRTRLQHSKLSHWLDMIETFNKNENLSIILVGTHAEEKSSFQLENLLQAVQNQLCHQYPRIRCITSVSCTTRQGTVELGEHLFRITSQNMERQGCIPAKFSILRNAILQESQREVPVMFWEEFREAASLFSLHGKELYDVAQFLLSTGTLFFQPQALSLRDDKITFNAFFSLSRSWLGNMILSLLRSSQVVDGIVTKSDLETVWRTASIPLFLLQPLIDLLRSMEVLHPIPEHFLNMNSMSKEGVIAHIEELERERQVRARQPRRFKRSSGSHNVFVSLKQVSPKYIVPALIPRVCAPELFRHLWGDSAPEHTGTRRTEYLEYTRVWRFTVLQDELWNRLYTQLLQSADCVPAFWRQGILLSKGNTFACVDRFPKSQMLALRVRTRHENSKKEIFSFFRALVNMVKSTTQYWFETNSMSILAPCPHCLSFFCKVNRSSFRPAFLQLHMFTLTDCTTAASTGDQFLICPRVYKTEVTDSPDPVKTPPSAGKETITRGRFSGELKSRSKGLFNRRSQDLSLQLGREDIIKRASPGLKMSAPQTAREEYSLAASTPPSDPPLRERLKGPSYPRKRKSRPASLYSKRSVSQKLPVSPAQASIPHLELARPPSEGSAAIEPHISPRGTPPVKTEQSSAPVSLKETASMPRTRTPLWSKRSLETYAFSSSGKDLISSLSPRRRKTGRNSTNDAEAIYSGDEKPCVTLLWDPPTHENRMFHTRVRLDQLVPDIILVDLDDVRIEQQEITLGDALGEGAFGEVRKGVYKGQTYAVKTLTSISGATFDEFSREVALMSKLQHPNLVNLVCFCTDPSMIVMEFVPSGELYTFLHNKKLYKKLDWKMRTRIAIDIARGMSFLHSVTPPVIHRDLKSPNILMVTLNTPASLEEPMAKITDFGLSTYLYNNQVKQSTSKRDVQTPTWLAPEVLRAEPYGEEADCYSMGIVMWELLVPGEHPFDEFNFGNFTSQLEEAIMEGTRPSIPEPYRPLLRSSSANINAERTPQESLEMDYVRLMASCWSADPHARPTFLQIAFKLTKRYNQCFG